MINKIIFFVTEESKFIAKMFIDLLDLIDLQCEIRSELISQDFLQKYSKIPLKKQPILFFLYNKEEYQILQTLDLPNEKYIIYLSDEIELNSNVEDNSLAILTPLEKEYHHSKYFCCPYPLQVPPSKYLFDICFIGKKEFSHKVDPSLFKIVKPKENYPHFFSNSKFIVFIEKDDYLINSALSLNPSIIYSLFEHPFCKFIDNISQLPFNDYTSEKKINNISNFTILQLCANLFNIESDFTIIKDFAIKYKYHEINHCINDIKNNMKVQHRFNCFYNIPVIENILIDEFGFNTLYESVLIEMRPLPHLFFLLKNTILKLPSSWNHTVVCGNKNIEMITSMCNTICKNINSKIKIINLEIDNLTRDDYCHLLCSSSFWERFEGEKILLYQEDTCIFHGKIEPFLKYDYIGAPWTKLQDDNSYHVGNGGFSLRSKSKMIEVIKRIHFNDLTYGKSTHNYMKTSGLGVPPEDVYFSKALIDLKIGKVAKYEEAQKFSQESIQGNNPFGGHNFWLANKNLKVFKQLKLYDDKYFKSVKHRGGWKQIMENLFNKKIISEDPFDEKILFLDIVSKYFLWDKQSKIIEKPWIGVIHIVSNTPSYLHNICIFKLFDNQIFKSSLLFCKCLIVLSQDLKNFILKTFSISIPIYVLMHPIETIKEDPEKIFNFLKFKEQSKNLSVVQLGQQLRYVTSIYKLDTSFKKIWLPGRSDSDYISNLLSCECNSLDINITDSQKENVEIKYISSFEEYDQLISNNIIFIHLINASANNAILELLVRNIPFFVNRLPAVEEYLGAFYPMYFENLEEIEKILNDKEKLFSLYEETNEYLKKIDKNKFSLENFNSELLKIVNN